MYLEKFDRIKSPYADIVYFGLIAKVLEIAVSFVMLDFIGKTLEFEVYEVAFAATMLFTKIIADGIIVALVPPFQNADKEGGVEGRFNFMDEAITGVFFFSLVAVGIHLILAEPIIKLSSPGISGEELEYALDLFKLGVPIMIFHFLRSVCGGYLQSDHRFASGAKSGIANALVFMIYLLLYRNKATVRGLMIVGVIAVFVQMFIMMKTVSFDGYRYQFNFNLKSELLKNMFKYLLPIATVGFLSYIVSRMDAYSINSILDETTFSLNNANQIIAFIRDIIIVGLVTVMYPILSESFVNEDLDGFKRNAKFSVYLLLVIILPVSALIFGLSKPLIRIIYDSQNLNPAEVAGIARVLKIHALGLLGSMVEVLAYRMNYSILDFKGAIKMGVTSLAINYILNQILGSFLGINGIVLATIISTYIVATLGIRNANKHAGFVSGRIFVKNILRIGASLLAMIVTEFIVYEIVVGVFTKEITGDIITLGIVGFLSIFVYVLVLTIFGIRMNIRKSAVR